MQQSNEAQILHAHLSRLLSFKEVSMADAWSKILGTKYGETQFVIRHLEVCNMYSTILDDVATMDEADSAMFYEYSHQWWSGIVGNGASWENAVPQCTDLTQPAVHLLRALAGNLAYRLPVGISAKGIEKGLAELRAQTIEWDALLKKDAADLPNGFVVKLEAAFMNIRWLIDNVELYGTARVQKAATDAMGLMTVSSYSGSAQKTQAWGPRINKFLVTVAAISLSTSAIAASTEQTVKSISNITTEIVAMQERFETPENDSDRSDDAANQKKSGQLEAKPGDSAEDVSDDE
ncbi:hypothetical protein [Solicola sp. PLA-1-18]|uniref:hypothetical protein n=1 Tax=Solicola sp. PLA-1-18 TaxID=3380532 RepID=UPI003B7984BA